MKRQRGRNRGGGGSNSSSNNKPTQNANRAFDSNGPEGVKVRGNPQLVFEKYQQLARDANAAGDRVLGENYLQHAEHYFRLLRAIQPNRPASEILGRDHFSSGYDIDFEDETGQAQAIAADEAAAEAGEPREDTEPRDQNRPRERTEWQARDRDDRPRDERPRDERPREDRPREDRPREDRPREDRPREDRPRNEGGNRERFGRDNNRDRNRPREDRPKDDRPRAEGEEPRRERFDRQDRAERPERVERDPAPVVQPQVQEEPRGVMLRDSDGGASHAPAFLQARPAPAPTLDTADEKPVRVRRRKPKSFEAGEGNATSETEDA